MQNIITEDEMLDAAISWVDSNGVNALEPEQLASLVQSLHVTVTDAVTKLAGVEAGPAGFRTRYRSEPGMIGHYPWTYADEGRRRQSRPEYETEDLYTLHQAAAKVVQAVLDEREACAKACDAVAAEWATFHQVAPAAAYNCASDIRARAQEPKP